MSDINKTDDEQLESPARRALFRRFAPEQPTVVPDSHYPRPPWAVENALFLALCTQCDACISQCPMRVLGKSDEKEEILHGRPILDLAYGSCDFCGQCVDACPSGALDKDRGKKRQVIPLLTGSCQAELGMYCHLCAEACNEQAIEFNASKKPVIDLERCTGCGECTMDCYSRVLIMSKH
ncbi:ferredoxin-type protein NapF [uncultured Endozoicomonas sp.]|uniref:ferredoxin-type protein NapF n=1 Tax=uncultured Endozoicomonas sp. TaxID=432652 RepID=UPI00262BBFE1|nr:ferredoxin-type protein NapF [uncultured Endozoicomonas sp.]